MNTSEEGKQLIRDSEGLRLESYPDAGGKMTIGYGHTGNVKQGMIITLIQAEEILQQDIEACEIYLNSLKLSLNQNQYDACIDFIFNLGAGNFGSSTLYRLLLKQDYKGAGKQFNRWIYTQVNGKMVALPGLVIRRQKETDLFNRS